MKKKLIALVLAVMTMVSLTACVGGKYTCDICGEEKSGKKYTETFFGEKMTVCPDCHD